MARAGAGTKRRVERALLGPAHHIGARLEDRTARLRDQLAKTWARRRSELDNADGGATAAAFRVAPRVGDLPTSSGGAVQLIPE